MRPATAADFDVDHGDLCASTSRRAPRRSNSMPPSLTRRAGAAVAPRRRRRRRTLQRAPKSPSLDARAPPRRRCASPLRASPEIRDRCSRRRGRRRARRARPRGRAQRRRAGVGRAPLGDDLRPGERRQRRRRRRSCASTSARRASTGRCASCGPSALMTTASRLARAAGGVRPARRCDRTPTGPARRRAAASAARTATRRRVPEIDGRDRFVGRTPRPARAPRATPRRPRRSAPSVAASWCGPTATIAAAKCSSSSPVCSATPSSRRAMPRTAAPVRTCRRGAVDVARGGVRKQRRQIDRRDEEVAVARVAPRTPRAARWRTPAPTRARGGVLSAAMHSGSQSAAMRAAACRRSTRRRSALAAHAKSARASRRKSAISASRSRQREAARGEHAAGADASGAGSAPGASGRPHPAGAAPNGRSVSGSRWNSAATRRRRARVRSARASAGTRRAAGAGRCRARGRGATRRARPPSVRGLLEQRDADAGCGERHRRGAARPAAADDGDARAQRARHRHASAARRLPRDPELAQRRQRRCAGRAPR